jgi:hypothetical protein
VATANLSEFRRVEGLRCEDWLAPTHENSHSKTVKY